MAVYKEPYVRNGTLFLDPRTPDAITTTALEKKDFLEVFVPVIGNKTTDSIKFGEKVLEKILSGRRNMADPVIIGNFGIDECREWENILHEKGLSFVEQNAKEYEAVMREATSLKQRAQRPKNSSRKIG